MRLLVFGMNHRSAPLEVRERYAVENAGPALAKLVGEDVDEAVIVSTCNRVELVVTTRRPEAARMRMVRFFQQELASAPQLPGGLAFEDYCYEHVDREAIRHVYRVASSIDSMVVGEPQILGQMKDAYRDAVQVGACGPILSRLFQHAFAAAKRVKTETRIAERPVSVARVAVDLAEQIFESLEGKSALLVGAGEMIEAALQGLQRDGLSHAFVANRTRANADELASRFAASAHGLDELDALLARADVVLTSIGGEGPLIGRARVSDALRARHNRPIFLIDIGVPRNVDSEVNELDNAYLYDIDDLQEVAAKNALARQRETERAEAIVLEEEQRFDGWLGALRAVPTIRDLREQAEDIRAREIERAAGRLGLDEAQREGVDALTRAIVNKLLHQPLSRLRSASEAEEGIAVLEAARSLFGLDGGRAADRSRARESADDPDEP